jgi:hypothetical protein
VQRESTIRLLVGSAAVVPVGTSLVHVFAGYPAISGALAGTNLKRSVVEEASRTLRIDEPGWPCHVHVGFHHRVEVDEIERAVIRYGRPDGRQIRTELATGMLHQRRGLPGRRTRDETGIYRQARLAEHHAGQRCNQGRRCVEASRL